jgi:DNA-binding NarL/FixJ family response regulator
MTVSVMIVDDHPIWRDGVARDLAERGFAVRATAPDGDTAVRLARTVRPDVVLMDLNLGETSGVAAIRAVTTELPATRVLVLSASGEHEHVLHAVTAGASGYLVKSATVDELATAVHRTAAGEAVFTPGLAGMVLGEYRRMAHGPSTARRPPRLTDRETEVLRLLATGAANREIARTLFVTEATVKSHLAHIFTKLDVDSRSRAIHVAREAGLI